MEIKVGMADLNVCESPDSIITLGLGSCVEKLAGAIKEKLACVEKLSVIRLSPLGRPDHWFQAPPRLGILQISTLV